MVLNADADKAPYRRIVDILSPAQDWRHPFCACSEFSQGLIALPAEQVAITAKSGNTKTIYYVFTNFYFEIDQADKMHKFGKSKGHRQNPLVQMGLAMDTLTEYHSIMSFSPETS